jgi:hypothetical protein
MPAAILAVSWASYAISHLEKSFTLCLTTNTFCGEVTIEDAEAPGVSGIFAVAESPLASVSFEVLSLHPTIAHKNAATKKTLIEREVIVLNLVVKK